ncbi:hypothetical protein EDB89DRAFT_1906354 [Lactarius sanguifluus]|nr:hypothetical protein EDB89DRAFT_1906354 [Lactarius sanguifluus]
MSWDLRGGGTTIPMGCLGWPDEDGPADGLSVVNGFCKVVPTLWVQSDHDAGRHGFRHHEVQQCGGYRTTYPGFRNRPLLCRTNWEAGVGLLISVIYFHSVRNLARSVGSLEGAAPGDALLAWGAQGSDTTGDGIFDMKSKSSPSSAPPDNGAGGGPIGWGLAVIGLGIYEIENRWVNTVAKFLAALERLVAILPTPEELTGLNQMVCVELRTVASTFNKKEVGAKMPRVHLAVQAIGVEWVAAKCEKCDPDWDQVTVEYITQLCQTMEDEHPDWHESFTSHNLSSYLDGIEPSKMWWWLPDDKKEDADLVMLNAVPPPSKLHTSLAPLKSSITTCAKGKAPAIPTPAPPPAPQNRLHAKKWCADDSPDGPNIESEDRTPQMSTHPQVEVVITSPPCQGKHTCRDNSETVATGDDRCGPCIDREDEECWPQPTGRRGTTTCMGCAKMHKTCNPPATWAVSGPHSDTQSNSSAWTRTPSTVTDAQIEVLTQQVQDMSLELSEVKKTLAILLEENRRGCEESREESRHAHEEARHGRQEFRSAHQYMHDTVLMVGALLAKQGIVSMSIPGVGQPPVSRSRTHSLTNPPTTSPGISLSTLKISNGHSTASSRASSATSERRHATAHSSSVQRNCLVEVQLGQWPLIEHLQVALCLNRLGIQEEVSRLANCCQKR